MPLRKQSRVACCDYNSEKRLAHVVSVIAILLCCWACPSCLASAHSQPDTAHNLGNQWIAVTIHTSGTNLGSLQVKDLETGRVLFVRQAFSLSFADGRILHASGMHVIHPLSIEEVAPQKNASRYSDREPGKRACIELADPQTSLDAEWCGVIRKGSAYFRQQLSIRANAKPLSIQEVRLIDVHSGNARVVGTVKGSPVADDTMFFAFENPLSTSDVDHGRVTATLTRTLPLHREETITYSSVIGIAQPGQMRRAFREYIERERPRIYQPFLNYNSWYDLGFGDQNHGARYDSAGALNRIREFSTELVEKRHVQIDSFLFDDGWDDTGTTWKFNSGFIEGFTPERHEAAQYHAGIGVWLSPWGGYDKERGERVAAGRKAGFETINNGLALSGTKYYQRFENVCVQMVKDYDVNYFKFDGTGNADQVFPGSQFDSDFDAAIHLIEKLRAMKPNLFVNVTTGTKPSPFWLLYADSIWRGGDDHAFAGVGSARQRWITYRDSQTYANIVTKAPLFPLNSLMLHGIIYAQYAVGLSSDPSHDFGDEVYSFFGSGTQLQEMYITPSLLSSQDWDLLAQGATWARRNASILRDVHWIGGNPAHLEVYGWAAWEPGKGIVTLRNPSNHKQEFLLDVKRAFELPPHTPLEYRATDTWNPHAKPLMLRAGKPTLIRMKPFEVLTLEAKPIDQ